MNETEKFKILVVDDERANIEALSFILKPKYKMLVAKDGPTALEYAMNKNPDLILLDIILPGMNGFEILEKLKSSDITRSIPVIFITGLDDAEYECRGFALGAADYITKPFHDFIVEARVRNHIQMIEYIRMIERMCKIDPLTNIPNRRHFDNQILIEWEKAIEDKKPLGLLMIDIDKFKVYNDSYGHLQGDKLLKEIAASFRETVKRPNDLVARWGGEEFAALLPDTDLNGAVEVAERIRTNIENAVIPCVDGKPTKITVSVGVTSQTPVPESSINNFISSADKALYLAKAAGRNKTKTYI